MSLRDERQQEFAEKWLMHQQGILYLCPRFGKIKTSINIMEKLGNPKTLIIYPIDTIKKSWKDDFAKWGYDVKNVVYTSTASLWKQAEGSQQYDLIIVDEIHLLSPANRNELKALMDKGKPKILGLTGTLADDTRSGLFAELGLDVVATYDMETGIRERIVTDYQIIVVTAHLDNSLRYIQPSKKLKAFMVTEKERYDWISKKMAEIKQGVITYNRGVIESGYGSPLDMRAQMGMYPLLRMHVLKGSVGKLLATKKLLERAQANNQRVLVFCGTIETANSLDIPVFHSKAKDIAVRDAFCAGEGDFLATVDMFEAGVTVKPINVAIISSFDSNPENLAQRVSRLTGYEYDNPDKVAKVYIVCTDTIEKVWLNQALEFFDPAKIKYINL